MKEAIALLAGLLLVGVATAQLPLDAGVTVEEKRRGEVIERISRSTIAIFERDAGNGGSGVIVREDGLAVTNFHVTSPCGPLMLVGTNDGRVHEAVLLGLDPTGDIALIRLLGDGPFPAAELGDSDRVRVGDRAIVVGNPFLLAEDFTPTVTVGVISGVHRYQPPSGSVLEYADCLQTDAAINPGNSGGPLFDGQGRLIGINGRGSFEKRGRVNVGIGYAVSINQVKRFLKHLENGLIADHASLGATAITRNGPQAIVDAIEIDSDVYRRGLRPGDEIVSLAGRDTPTANALLNALGVLPAGWRTRIEFRRDGRLYDADIRLGPLHAPGVLEAAIARSIPPGGVPGDPPPAQLFEAREGYTNYAAARAATDRLLSRCVASGAKAGPVSRVYEDALRGEAIALRLDSASADWVASSGEHRVAVDRDLNAQAGPPAAPALLGGVWVWSRLASGESGAIDRVEVSGRLPWRAMGEPHDVLLATHRGLRVEVYFDPESGEPVGFEATRDTGEDAVRVAWGGGLERVLPVAMTVTVADRLVADLRAMRAQQPDGSPGEGERQ
ncbi:Periplasmic serine endoprotease DegP precursor [Planctomycetes bacterium MalM25]|nr:Periplasmic serine endoprotease DegP precursor [Planctomycetes bacterium MalM25]